MIFSLEFCPQTYYQLSVKVELGIFPDMQAQNLTSSASFLMKQMEDGLYQHWRKPREEDMEFSKRRDRRISFRTKVTDGKLASGPRKQLIQIEARKRRLQGKTELKVSLMCLAI